MRERSIAVKLIGYGLSAVYGAGLLIYLMAYIVSFFDTQAILGSSFYFGQFETIGDFRAQAILFGVLYLPQLIAFLAVARFREWGRKLAIILQGVLCVYFGYQVAFMQNRQPLVIAAIFIYLALIMFFLDERIKMQFRPRVRSRGQTVLVADDDRSLLRAVRNTLLNDGFDVIAVTSGEKALRLARRRPALIILDVILPGIKGRDVCVKLKEDPMTRDIPVVFLSVKDSPDDVRAEMAAGGAAHISKPFDAAKLLSEINKILG